MNTQSMQELLVGFLDDAFVADRKPVLITFNPQGYSQFKLECYATDAKDQFAGVPIQQELDQTELAKLWCEGDQHPEPSNRAGYRALDELMLCALRALGSFEPSDKFLRIQNRDRNFAQGITIGGRKFSVTISEL